MPLSTMHTPSKLAAKRSAWPAGLLSIPAKVPAAWGGRLASAPPRTGSITITGFWKRRQISYSARLSTLGLS